MGSVKERVQAKLDEVGGAEFNTTEWLDAVADLKWFCATPYDESNGLTRVKGFWVENTTSRPISGTGCYVTLKSEKVKKGDILSPYWMSTSVVAVVASE
jgi:hypothetical protein